MKITIKAVKIAEFLSEETTAFAATLYVDGKRTARVQNDGHGGCNFYDCIGMPQGSRERLTAAKAAANAASGWESEGLDGFVETLLSRPGASCELDRETAEACDLILD